MKSRICLSADGSRWRRRWIMACTSISGVLALLWLLLRSGIKPTRFAYPCQQAALSTAALAFSAPLAAAVLSIRRGAASGRYGPARIAAAGLGLLATLGAWGFLTRADSYQGIKLDPPEEYRAQVYHVTDCPQDPMDDRFVGLENLITLMGQEGLKFYLSPTVSPLAGPDGIIAADDVVIIKINYQWPERGGTNTDVLRGLIRLIVDHPDTFSGEVVVCENAQFNPVDYFDRSENNAQDITLSPHDGVVGFQGQGYNLSHYDWTSIRRISVGEYSEGNMTDGYVVYPYDSEIRGRVSYPKFQSDSDTYISLKQGIWDPISETYDREHLKFINLPVLKSHHAVYGATACVKNYMGVVTDELNTNSHNAIRYGILGALLGEIGLADLNILDCVWINANPHDGPWTSYGTATRMDELVASVDPVAADVWAVKNILVPAFLSGGYTPPWPNPSADPDDPNSAFRKYLDNSMYQILAAGHEVTNSLDQIDVYSIIPCDDMDGDGYDDELCGGTDCDDQDPNVHPGMQGLDCSSTPDGIDNDCDGQLDEDPCSCFIGNVM